MRAVRILTVGLLFAVAAPLAGCGAKSGLWEPEPDADVVREDVHDVPDRPPEVVCLDDELWTAPGRRTVVEARVEDEGDPPPALTWTLAAHPTGSAATLAPLHTWYTALVPDLLGDYVVRFQATDRTGRSDSCQTVVHAVNNPPVALCPPDVPDARVGVPVPLEGDGDDTDGRIVGFEWSIRERPAGSTSASLVPPDEASTQFTADVEGDYGIRFEVIDDNGYRGQCILTVTAVGAPPLDCPEEILTGPTRRPLTIPAIPVLNGDAVTWIWELVSWPATSAGPAPTPPDAASPTIVPDKPGRYVLRARATNARGLSSECEVLVDATPSGPDAICPAETCTVPLNTITLTGSGVDDGTVVGYHWELTTRPEGSSCDPPSPASSPTSEFTPDVAGTYRITLTVTDDEGNTGSCTFDVVAVPSEGLRVEMFWNPPDRSCVYPASPPSCDASDVDLHLLHPWATRWFSELDCYYANCNASAGAILSWDAPGREDDPRLDLDDVDGYGPENINIDEPVAGHEYTVGVHYYWAESSGDAHVYVKIYCASTSGECESGPPVEFGPVTLRDPDEGPGNDNEFWRVATIMWNGATCTVRSLANPDGTPNITTYGVVASGR